MLLQVNTITLALNPTKTIFTACAQTSGLTPALIVSGLHGTKQTDGVGPEVTVTYADGTSTVVSSTWSGGNMTIVLSADIPDSVTTQFSFQLVNSYSAQSPITDALIEVAGLGLADTDLAESAGFLQIIQAEWTEDAFWSIKSVQDTSNYPCDLNNISVTVTPAVTIKSCADYVEFTGFVGTMTDDLPPTLSGTSTQGVFNSNAVWTKADGKLKVFLTGNLNAGTQYTFGFQVRNGLDGQGAQTISIEAPLVSSTNIVAMSGAVLEILSPD